MEKYLESLFKNKNFGLTDLCYLIENSESKNHHFIVNKFSDDYLSKLSEYINFATLNISSINLYKRFFKEKLQFSLKEFNEQQFFQCLAEVVVIGGIYELINASPSDYSDFESEKKLGTTKKDVDSSVFWISGNCNLNIEVKCPNYDQCVDYNNKEISWGRLKNKEFNKELYVLRRDGKAKDYLISAHEKFEGSSTDDVNILVICVSEFIDQAEWVSYYIQNETENYTGGIIIDPNAYGLKYSHYENVDFIMVSDAYIRMKNNPGKEFFNLNQCYNTIFPNDRSLRNKVFLTEISEIELQNIKKINTIKNYKIYQKKYPKLFKYFRISELFNANTSDFLYFLKNHKYKLTDNNWIFYLFLISNEFNRLYPSLKIEIGGENVFCGGNKYSKIIEYNQSGIISQFKNNNIENLQFDVFFNFLDSLDDKFIISLSYLDNSYKIYDESGKYNELTTFINIGLNLFNFKVKYEKNTPIEINFKEKNVN
ncbi:hypothetical protein [uncultured Acinetobacter sp.]|uniref:hypothetical protein n=1 Tax=uncultured Acinetobacter sp. TaxID=165433 RepID=UPI00258D229A|nr:hypothetical protein [uncultured Acinetobacter sp.]